MHLNTDEMINAFGLATIRPEETTRVCMMDPGQAHRTGFRFPDGIMAALLARRGVTGPQNIIDGKAGLYKVYHRGHFDPDILLHDLGNSMSC
jgi:2-methylcitrate dehydratase PrpD